MSLTNAATSLAEDLKAQKAFLNNGIFGPGLKPRFQDKLNQSGLENIKAGNPEIFQVNIGYMCNQTCKHCHVDAGPHRKEIMSRKDMDLCLEKIAEFGSDTVDITGGAPEMNPDFRYFIEELKKIDVKEIIVRSNLTIILANPKYYDLPDYFAQNEIRLISSLPFYHEGRTDRQRGKGVFSKSIEALKKLNDVGYGKEYIIDLVYNPGGAFLPAAQEELESQYKKVLMEEHGIVFNELFTLTNLPVNRFLDYLIASENYEDYMDLLINAFNPSTLNGLMCRNTISVDYQGNVYDCDFNQMLKMGIESKGGNHLSQLSLNDLKNRPIITSQHCYGCTAGAGSSCQGTLT